MEHASLVNILRSMQGTDLELDLILMGEDQPLELKSVLNVETPGDGSVVKVTTKQNYLWIDASHVSAAWQARSDL